MKSPYVCGCGEYVATMWVLRMWRMRGHNVGSKFFFNLATLGLSYKIERRTARLKVKNEMELIFCRNVFFFSFFSPNATACSYELSWFPSWLWRQCSQLLSLGRPLGATTLYWWCEWWHAGRWNTRRDLKPKSTNYPDHDQHGNLSLQGKIPMVEPGIEPGTSWLVVRDPDHYTTRLVIL